MLTLLGTTFSVYLVTLLRNVGCSQEEEEEVVEVALLTLQEKIYLPWRVGRRSPLLFVTHS